MSQKENLIKFLQGRTTTFTVGEVNAIIGIVSTLEEPKAEVEDKKKK